MAQIPNLFNGISQQAPALRHPSQAEEQINAMSSVSRGVFKRPPLSHVAQLFATNIGDAYVHFIDRDATERYAVVITDGDLDVFDENGASKTVAFPNGKTYLDATDPRSSFAAITIADHTFIANKGVETAMTAALDPTSEIRHAALLTLTIAPYGEDVASGCGDSYITVTVNGTTKYAYYADNTNDLNLYAADLAAQFRTAFPTWTIQEDNNHISFLAPHGTTVALSGILCRTITYDLISEAPDVYACVNHDEGNCYSLSYDNLNATDALFIVVKATPTGYTYYVELDGTTVSSSGGGSEVVAQALTTAINGIGGFSAVTYGTMVKVTKNAGTTFTWSVWDGYGNQGLSAMKNGVHRFSDLPARFVENYAVKIQGQSNAEGAYYMEWNAATGRWSEVRAPGLDDAFDATTMPHILVREADGTFTFKVATWDEAGCGDATSTPNPSFIGETISDLFFYRNRLGMLSGENYILSRAGEYYAFWPSSATDILDSDAIDSAAVHTRESLLKHAVPFNEALLLFSPHTQFRVSAEGILSPRTVRCDPTTEFASSATTKPVGIGPNLYFVSPRGDYSQLREYFVEPDTIVNDASDVTAHVDELVPKDVFSLVGNSNEDLLLALSKATGHKNRLYVYKFYWQGQEKLQSSWSYWETGADDVILGAGWMGTSKLALIIQRADGVYLETMVLNGDTSEAAISWLVHLDRRTSLTGSYNAGTDVTTWTLPYSDDSTEFRVVLGSAFTGQAGRIITPSRPTATTLTAIGDFSAGAAYVGKRYVMRYRFSEQFPREARGATEVALIDGRFQLRRFKVRYEDTGYFRAVVAVTGRDDSTYAFTGKVLGATFVAGETPIVDGTFTIPVTARSSTVTIDLINDSPMPSQFLSADVEALHVRRSI